MFRPRPLPRPVLLPCTPDPALPGWEATATIAVLTVVLILVRGGYSPVEALAVAVLAGTASSQLRATWYRSCQGVA